MQTFEDILLAPIVGPCPPERELEKLGDTLDISGADRPLTSWKFTLSFKMAYIVGYLVAFISFLNWFQ